VTKSSDARSATDAAPTDRDYVAMGARLREAREFLGLSQEIVAESLNVPRASVSAMESGRRKVSSLELRDLSRLYKRPIEFFLNEESHADLADDETVKALFRATNNLTQDDKEQVLRFAEFLRGAGKAPARRQAR
jgi:transcriptional regulator with XRE-family HTH domain